jgi:uncharacterized delta-60 repeat protein
VVVGFTASINNLNGDFLVMRYDSMGVLDNGFGSNGITTTDFGILSPHDIAYAVSLQSDGKIVVSGGCEGVGWDFALSRYNTNGTLDPSFGTNGQVKKDITHILFDDCAYDISMDATGKILALGESNLATCVVKFKSDGTLDSSFGNYGEAHGLPGNRAYCMALQQDGKILSAGIGSSVKVFRLTPNGSLDQTFGQNGQVIDGASSANSVKVQPDGKFLVAGYQYIGTNCDFTLSRYMGDFNLGIIDFSDLENQIIIYPNPMKQKATVKFELPISYTVTMDLFNSQGKLLKTYLKNRKLKQGRHEQQIFLDSTLPMGVYYLVLSIENKKIAVKIFHIN